MEVNNEEKIVSQHSSVSRLVSSWEGPLKSLFSHLVHSLVYLILNISGFNVESGSLDKSVPEEAP